MSNPLDVPRIQAVQKTDVFELILLLCGIFILSLAAIFIQLSENKIGPYATIFNRFWIGGFSLILWNIITKVRHRLIHGFPMKAENYTSRQST